MKKLVLASSLLCAAFALKADLVLCWTTPDSSTSAIGWWGLPTTIGSATDKEGNSLGSVSYAKLGYFTDNSVREHADYAANANYAYSFDQDTYTAGSTITEVAPAGEGWSVIDANNYYYIALFNSQDQLVAYSQTFNSAQVTANTFSTTDFETLTNFSGAFAGSGYAVPEPTSGLLVLLGMAGLALRRRKIS
jgi:hypothetical protein